MPNKISNALEQSKQAFFNWLGGGQPQEPIQQEALRSNLERAKRGGFQVPTYAGPPVRGQSPSAPVTYMPARTPSPTPSPVLQTQRPQVAQIQSPSGNVDVAKIQSAIEQGLREYGANPRLISFAPKFAEAAQRYPVFAKNPFLLPQISILESSGGKHVTRENNPLNWGARVQAAGNYAPRSWEQSIEDAITAIGGDPNRGPAGSSRQRQTTYYQPFRESGDLKTFANIYEPDNGDYYNALAKGMPLFEKYYN